MTENRLTPGSLIAFLSYLSSFYGPVTALSELSITLQGALAVLRRVTAVFQWPEQGWIGTGQLDCCRGELELCNISFFYGPAVILEGLSLKVPAGEAMLIVGPSGVGKSTLAGVMAGLYTPSTGDVLLDGKPVKQRIALARALLRHPAVLILDEATTSVDSMEELRIQESLQAVRGLCTLIIITHRPENYPWVQHIYKLKHDSLLETAER